MSASVSPATQTTPAIEVPAVAPAGPHRRLADELVAIGHDPDVAYQLSRAVVNPTEAKKKLQSMDLQRTPTADIYSVATRAWAPLLNAHPDNKRETAYRTLPIAGAGPHAPLNDLSSDGTEPWLSLDAESMDQFLKAMRATEAFLIEDNPLWQQIGDEGVLRSLTVTGIKVRFTDGTEPIAIVSTGDGSSRAASSHKNLQLTAADVISFVHDDRAFRKFVAEWRSVAEAADPTEAELRAIRSLTVPVDIVVKIVPRPGIATTTARAIRSLVGLMHVQPPKEWSPSSKMDAQGEEVLDELVSEAAIAPLEREYLEGRVKLEDAAGLGLPAHADERAGVVLQLFRKNQTPVKRAIKRVTHSVRVGKVAMANVATELALRAIRRNVVDQSNDIHMSRVGLQLAYRLREIWEGAWDLTLRSPEAIRDAALAELDGDDLGPSQIELAVLGGFELAKVRVLAQYSITKEYTPTSLASPGQILRMMATTRRGVHTLYQAISEGRRGAAKFLKVDEHGQIVYDPNGDPEQMSARWLRDEFRLDTAPEPESETTPEEEYLARQDHIKSSVHSLGAQMTALAMVKDVTGTELIRTHGWRPEDAIPLVRELNATMRAIHSYVAAYRISRGLALGPDDDLAMSEPIDDEDAWE